MLGIVQTGFQGRPAPVRWLTYGCLDQPRLASILKGLFKGGHRLSEAAHADRIARYALSGMYNISYYQGLAAELGGERAFREVVGAARVDRS